MNERHALAFVEGKSVILSEKPDGGVAYGSVADLHALYENKRRATERSSEPISKAWMRHKGRATYPNGIVFAPAGGTKGAFNHWRGFAVEPSASGSCALFLEHLRDVVCGGDAVAYRWLLCWFAHMVQKPGEKPGTAVVLKGRKGTGKDTVAEYVGGLFPRHHTKIANAEHLYGKFNAHQEKTLLLHVEEGFWAGDKKAEGSLKYVITSEQVQIEPKGVNAFQVPSVLRVFISSNEDWVVPATFDERRFFVMNIRGEKRAPGYFSDLRQEMVNGGRPALLHHLQSLDLTDFDVRNPPITDGLRDQKLQSLRNIEKWWYELLVSEELPGAASASLDDEQSGGWSQTVEVGRGSLRGNYREWMRGNRFEGAVLTEAEFGKRLKDLVPTVTSSRPRLQSGARQRVYQVPALQQCRAQFESKVGLSIDWQ
jgi:phage/plasmid-associated DNA primase